MWSIYKDSRSKNDLETMIEAFKEASSRQQRRYWGKRIAKKMKIPVGMRSIKRDGPWMERVELALMHREMDL